ncbi:hypothetical protein [Encephalitozoon cuniculi GB-M1]|uniref:Uncharacterized protein n=1 Tax=Encephalitozoon cuniculi (strain GB-M1) TaxID=284813 RepID=Q8STX5_ENCCU|nr:uncharacterized protein ECU09_0210 [Encephalitozoon cuniculi GB-M1]CAD26992.1 hypothetical protein [Encephalitozoon cuniculi GB-M1]
MESLKRAKRVEPRNKAFEMYVKLKEIPQGSCVDDDVLVYLSRNMELRREIPATLLGIIEVLRINAPRCFLSKEERIRFFGLLIETLPKEKINLETFITYRIPSLLTEKILIAKLISLVGVVKGAAKQYLREIIIVMIEEGAGGMVREIVMDVLLRIPKDPTLNHIIEATKEISMPIAAVIMESLEDKVYADIYSNFTLREHLCIRNVRGQGKMRYLMAAMSETNFEKLCGFYIGDKDKKVIKILAEHCRPSHDEIFHRILNDCDEGVRTKLLEGITFEDVVEHELEVYERILDTSHGVRAIVFNIFRSGMLLHRDSVIEVREDSKENKRDGSESSNRETKCLLRFIGAILKGVFTKQRKEYVDLLNELNLPWEFYFRIRSFKGVTAFLSLSSETIKKESEDLPKCRDRRRFYLEHFFCGELSKEEIAGLIEVDVPSALAYLRGKSPDEYADLLMSRALSSNNIEEVLMVIDTIRPYLAEKMHPSCPKCSAELLVYAHSRHASCFIGQVLDFDVSFPMLYFLSHMKIPVDTLLPLLSGYRGSGSEYVEIQLAYNDKKLLQEYVNYFMEIDLDESSKRKLVGSRTFVGSMIYFVNTGQVNIRNINFFISSIHVICMSSSNETKIRQIYETYSMKVDQSTFNRFYTVCSRLKAMSLNKGPHEISDGKVVVRRNDKTLFFICETVLGVREGEVVGERFHLQGFHPIPENVLDMISLGRMM